METRTMIDSAQGMIFNKFADKKWVRVANDFFDSNAFVALLALVTVLTNALGAELLVYPLIISYGVFLCLFGRDMRSIAAAIPFMYLSPSVQNNPASNPNSILYPKNGLGLIIAYLLIFFAVLCVRIALGIKRGFFKNVRWEFLRGFAFLAVAFLLGGVGQSEYVWYNARYAGVLFASLFVVYFCLILLVDWGTVRRDYFAWIGLFMGLTVAFETVNIYLQGNAVDGSGHVLKDNIFTGWGMSNNIAGVLLCSIPFAFYLAAKRKNSVAFVLCATFIYLATIFTGSRNGVLVGGFAFLTSAVIALVPRENRRKNILTYLSVGIAVSVFYALFPTLTANIFDRWVTHGVSTDARVGIYKAGLEQFIQAPLLGKGFYACDAFAWGTEKITFIPPRWHSTIIQILASCGTVGFLAYGFHRYETIKCFLKKPTLEKLFIALSLATFLLSSLIDCFFFNIGPGLYYSAMLAFLEKSNLTIPEKAKLLGRGQIEKL